MGFLLLFLSSFSGWTQSSYSLVGSVQDSTGNPIEFANVFVLSSTDSSLIKGGSCWDGEFQIHGISQESFILKVASVGYSPYYRTYQKQVDGGVMKADTVLLSSSDKELSAVEILYIKPIFERKVGKLVVNVEGTIFSEKGTLIDLLRSTPNVIVKSDNSVSVVGRGHAIIYLDGRRVYSIDMIASLPSTDVERIEIIENPSARYDAEGNAVIEIITKSGALNGYEGTIGLRGMKRTDVQGNFWARFSFRKDWFSVYTSFGQYAGTLHEDEIYKRVVYDTPNLTMDNDVQREFRHRLNAWYYIDTDFRLDSVSTIFANYYVTGYRVQNDEINRNNLFEDSAFIGTLNSSTGGMTTNYMHSVATGYQRKLDTLGSDLRLTAQYTNFDSRNEDRIDQISDLGSSFRSYFQSVSFNQINVVTARFDLSKKWRDEFNASFGAKNGYLTNGSGIDFSRWNSGQWETDSTLYNQFDYRENILAAYTEIDGEIGKFKYQSGLRYEWTLTEGNSFLTGQGVVDQDYHNLFPNVQLSYDFTPDLVLGLSYTNKIQRPSYQALDPFISYIDSLSSFRGNPQLLPAYSHNADINLIYMEYASISFSYSYMRDPQFLTVIQNEGTNSFSAITQNIESSEAYTVAVVLPYELSWWTTFNAFGYTFNDFTFESDGLVVVNNQPSWYISLYNEFRIPKVCNIELEYQYITPGSVGFFIAQPMQSFGGSISRKFFDDKLTARFNIFDLFFTNIERAETTLPGFFVGYESRSDSRSFMLTLLWNFGKMKDKSMSSVDIDMEQKNRIEKD